VKRDESIRLVFATGAPFVDDHEVISVDLGCAGYVFGNWRLKGKSQVLSSLPGKKAEEY
jgi:hypothetical protein